MFGTLYQIIITPLIDLTEFFYQLFYETTNNMGLAVIGLSFVVTLFTLPLYMVAEQWQEKERQTQEKLKNGIKRIKETFKGDEQYMILTTFYRENHYHPIYALRSSFSLLIQIPFFIAAYNFLSDLEPLKEFSFLFIKSFGEPDATFHLGSIAVNVLPIAMTVINAAAGFIYSKGHPISEKVTIYLSAAIFLVLLYDSPAGLVLYWTFNNILSLVKNVFYKIKNPKKVLLILLDIVALVLLFAGIKIKTKAIFKLGICLFAVILPAIPFVCRCISKLLDNRFYQLDRNPKIRATIFYVSALCLAVLAGLVIPSTLMESEVPQYCYIDSFSSPWVFLTTPFFQALGFFVVWPACFYALFSAKTKKALSLIFSCAAFISILNTFAFSGNYGPIEPTLIFMQAPDFHTGAKDLLINGLATLVIIAVVIILIWKKTQIIQYGTTILLIALSAVSIKNIISIADSYNKMPAKEIKDQVEPVFHLSRNGKNVIVLMQDRCFLPFIPFVLEERPELVQKFDGFTFYKNSMSFAIYTMLGTPGIFGGYDYTPYEMNNNPKQKDKTLQQKHNEAILSMPKVFHDAGWNTTIADMPYENYLEQPTTSFYEDPYYKVCSENDPLTFSRVTTHGTYSDLWYKRNNLQKAPYMSTQIKRNFLLFSMFKMVAPVVRPVLYHNEYWLSWNKYDNAAKFIDNYSELDLLGELTDDKSEYNSFLLLDNEATHEPMFLQAPDYVPVDKVTDFGTSPFAHNDQYHTIAGTFGRLASFFDYLKEQELYDNTRIIIVSDHGKGFDAGVYEHTKGLGILKDNYTATVLVKDFGQRGPMKEDMTFMTNADTPYLATKNLIKDAKNPFTGNPFQVKDKNLFMKLAHGPAESTRIRHNKKFTVTDWWTVRDNIYDINAWGPYRE